jgi:copper chaperone NosL
MRHLLTLGLCALLALTLGCDSPEAPETPAPPPAPHQEPAPPPQAESGPTAVPALKGLTEDGAMQVSVEDRCPVCGMAIHEHPKFASAIELDSGESYYFCGTGCMMKSWLHPEIFLGHPKEALKRAFTLDYFDGSPLDALKAFWVAGSDVIGPMGPALVPLASEEDQATFMERHGGAKTFTLGELDDVLWETITGKKATMKPGGKKQHAASMPAAPEPAAQ